MGARVTMRDVAREAGVSPMTVSRALRADGTVNAETRAAVRAAATRLGYVYDTTAQAFRAQRSGFLAVTLPSLDNANFATTHRALTEALAGTDLQLLLGITKYQLDEEERLVRQLLARRPEAVILTGGHHTDAVRQLLTAFDAPVLEIWDQPAEPLGHVVGVSNADAMALIVDHLADAGHRKLGFLGATGDSDRRGAERRRGVRAAALKRGLPEVTLLEAGPAPISMSDGARAVATESAKIAGLDALICVSDPVAFGAIMALREQGLNVPRDLAVTGFGAFEVAGIAQPNITTLDVGAEAIGHAAGQLVRALLDGAPPPEASITPRLILGQSA